MLDDWIMPILHTINKAPEELTLHEAPMFQSYGIDFLRGEAWGEVDACLETLATKAVEQGHQLKFVLTTGVFGAGRGGPEFLSRLPSFAKKGTYAVFHSPPSPTYSYVRGPF